MKYTDHVVVTIIVIIMIAILLYICMCKGKKEHLVTCKSGYHNSWNVSKQKDICIKTSKTTKIDDLYKSNKFMYQHSEIKEILYLILIQLSQGTNIPLADIDKIIIKNYKTNAIRVSYVKQMINNYILYLRNKLKISIDIFPNFSSDNTNKVLPYELYTEIICLYIINNEKIRLKINNNDVIKIKKYLSDKYNTSTINLIRMDITKFVNKYRLRYTNMILK